jgi:glutamyl-tRNA synthetase
LLAWLSIRSRHGKIILRIEDIDSPRVKAWAIQQAMDDLRWLGLDWDEGPDVGGPHSPYIQSDRTDYYRALLTQLRAREWVYPCTCSRSDVAAAASAPHAGQEGPIYPGTCRSRRAGDAESLGTFAWRFRTTETPLALVDHVAGPRTCSVARELGDFVVARRDGTPAYQLAAVADDHAMGVTEVLRGSDLLPSAFRQLELYEAFEWLPPAYAHVPLVVGPDGRRLAKRHGDTRLSLIRAAGFGPEKLIGLLAWSCGLRPTPAATTARELLRDFDLGRLPASPWVLEEGMWRMLLAFGL